MTPSNAPLVIELTGLVRRFGTVSALRGVDLALAPGGAIGLLGPNGAGKSTLISVLLGFIAPTRGGGRVLGVNLSDAVEIRRRVGYLPEEDAWFPGMSGIELVSYSGRLAGLSHRRALARAHDVLGYVGLSEARHRPVQDYSRGMRQRVKLAHALTADPELLLLDEPATGLDPPGRAQMLELVTDLATRHGKTVVLSTHLLPDIERCCRRAVLMFDGRVAAAGELSELLAGTEARLHLRLDGEPERFCAALGDEGVEARLLPGGVVDCAGTADTRPLFALARRLGLVVRGLEPARRTLEDLFVEIAAREHDGEVR